jgi:hypothetical protein
VVRCCRRSRGGHREGAGKEERAGAHRNGGSTVRRCKRRRAAAFVGGEGPPVVAVGGDEALQLGRGEGVSDLQEILGIGSSGRSSLGSGGRWRCSAGIREGEGDVGGQRQRSRCGERLGGSGAREKESERSGDGRTSGAARAGSATEGKEKGKGGGLGRGGARRCGDAVGPGLDRRMAPDSGPSAALVGNVRCARACRPDRAGERCRTVLGGGATDRWGQPVSGRGGERGRAGAGPRRKRGGRAQMNSKVLHLFELV